MALVALAMVGIIAMAGLSIDIGTLYQASAEAQRAADAAALAAARTISMQGLTGDPANSSGTWSQICGGLSSLATVAAVTVVGQNPLSGASTLPTVTVSYSYSTGAPSTDCSSLANTGFGVNPQVTVLVQQANLPTYFSRIWGRTGNTVGVTATAEVFNPANSNTYAGSGEIIPVQPRCVKPWIVPNYDPAAGCGTGSAPPCSPLVSTAPGTNATIGRPGVSPAGVIGERFWLVADCSGSSTGTCTLLGLPGPNYSPPPLGNEGQNLQYVPGQTSFQSIAVPADGSAACSAVSGNYAQAIAGCDQSTQYQCGVAGATNPNQVNLAENPVATGDTTNGVECLIHQTVPGTSQLSGQDTLLPTGGSVGSQPPNYPFQIQVGSGNPLINISPNAVPGTGVITSSNNIVSLPIYDSSAVTGFLPGGTTPVTIIGFLQVFINADDGLGNVSVTVLNVSGCGNGTTAPVSSQPLYGTSPVPIRLITLTPPSS
jgi:hypothetical protein